MNTTKTLAGAAMAALLVAACGKLNMAESVRDLGFEVTAETAFSSDYLCNTLSLTLESGTEGEGEGFNVVADLTLIYHTSLMLVNVLDRVLNSDDMGAAVAVNEVDHSCKGG